MEINFSCEIGDCNVRLPINIGDIIISSSTKYSITKIVVCSNEIFAVNSSSGLWVNLKDLKLEKKETSKDIETNYFKIIH